MTKIIICKRLEEIISKVNIQATILGARHGPDNLSDREYNCYKEIIKNINPDFVLIEKSIIGYIEKIIEKPICVIAENNDITENWTEYIADMENESEIIIKTINSCFKLILCGLSDKEQTCVQNNLKMRLPKELIKKDFGFSDSFDTIDKDHPEQNLNRLFNNEREKRMGENIIKYSNKSQKSIIVIIGHEHAGECSNIHNILKKGKGINYIVLWRNKRYCRNCGQKIGEKSENENCDCGFSLYHFIVQQIEIDDQRI